MYVSIAISTVSIWFGVVFFSVHICSSCAAYQSWRIWWWEYTHRSVIITSWRHFHFPNQLLWVEHLYSYFQSCTANKSLGYRFPPFCNCPLFMHIWAIQKCLHFQKCTNITLFQTPSLLPSKWQAKIFGFQNMGFTLHTIYCTTTKINPSFKPVWYVTNDSFG